MAYNLLIDGVYWGYNPLTNHLLSSWDIQVDLALNEAAKPWSFQASRFLWFHQNVAAYGFVSAKCITGKPRFWWQDLKEGLTPIAWNGPLNQFATDMVESQKRSSLTNTWTPSPPPKKKRRNNMALEIGPQGRFPLSTIRFGVSIRHISGAMWVFFFQDTPDPSDDTNRETPQKQMATWSSWHPFQKS